MHSSEAAILTVIVLALLSLQRCSSEVTWDDDDYPRPRHQDWDEGGRGDEEDDIPWEKITFTPDMIDKVLHVLAENSGRRDPMKVIRAALFPMGFQNDRTLFGDYSRGFERDWIQRAKQKDQDSSPVRGVTGQSGALGDEEEISDSGEEDKAGNNSGKRRAKKGTLGGGKLNDAFIGGGDYLMKDDYGGGLIQNPPRVSTTTTTRSTYPKGWNDYRRDKYGFKVDLHPDTILTDDKGNKYFEDKYVSDAEDLAHSLSLKHTDDKKYGTFSIGSHMPAQIGRGCNPLKNNCIHPESVSCMTNQTDDFGKPVYWCMCDYLHTRDPTVSFAQSAYINPCLSNLWVRCTAGSIEIKCMENMDCLPDPLGIDTEKYCQCKKGFAPAPNEHGIIALCRPLAHHELADEDNEPDYSRTDAGTGLRNQLYHYYFYSLIIPMQCLCFW